MHRPHFNTDQELLAAFSEASPDALERVFDMYYQKMVYYAFRLINNMNESEDIVVDSLVRVFQKRRHFELLENLKAYLYVSVRNQCNDYLRRASSTRQIAGELLQHTIITDRPADSNMIMAETMGLIYHEIETLPSQCRTVVRLRIIDRHSIPEIAEQLGISSKTVSNQLSLGLKQLRSSLLKKGLLLVLPVITSMLEKKL